MIKSPLIPVNETERLKALQSYEIMHTDINESAYKQITDLASQITGMPVSLISLVDKEEVWFKATKGVNICSASRTDAFCSYAVGQPEETYILEDIKKHPEMGENPFANNGADSIQFYAGICLIDSKGYRLGTLCVIDYKPNHITKKQIKALQILSKQVIKLIELHKTNLSLVKAQQELEKKNESLKNFAGIVSHDMKMPLANIILTADMLKAKYGASLDEQANTYLDYLKTSSFILSDYITGLLDHYESDNISEGNTAFDLNDLLEEIIDLLYIKFDCEIHLPENNIELNCNRSALAQILLNLIANSLKYNDKEKIVINIDAESIEDFYTFKITDNGIGIAKEKQAAIFNLFTTLENKDRNGNKGNGIGLSTVKKIIISMGGAITVNSEQGIGTSFIFSIAKNLK